MMSIKQGSGCYRKIIARSLKPIDIHNPSNWKNKLKDDLITRTQLRQARINLHSKYIGSDVADTLTRLKLGKTLFGTQLYKCGLTDNPFCNTCVKELDEEIPENLTHATYECRFVADIVLCIQNTFFPNINTIFHNRDTLLAVTEDKHPLYAGNTGQLLASLIWDLFLFYIVTCRNNRKTPIAAICIHNIKSQINRVLKILPHSEISHFINNTATLRQLFLTCEL